MASFAPSGVHAWARSLGLHELAIPWISSTVLPNSSIDRWDAV